jgi:two-component system, cell cycle sensor histidine kinase and response regulator CckA
VLGRQSREAEESRLTSLPPRSDHFELALTAAGMHTWAWDIATGNVVWSEGIEGLVGLAHGSFGGTFEGYQKVLFPADLPKVLGAIEASLASDAVPYEIEHRVLLPDGAIRWLGCRGRVLRGEDGRPVRMLGVVWDVSARKLSEARIAELSAQLLQSDRLAALGRLAGGVAHEINNPLAYVVLNLELAARKLAAAGTALDVASLRTAIDDARDGTERVRRIVRGLGAFSRGDDEPVTAVDVHHAIDAAIKITENGIRHKARLTTSYAAARAVRANESRLVQVLVNLLLNASDAISQGSVDHDEIRIETALAPEGVTVTVSDTGDGIAPEARARLFDPFFTTKPLGKGTGLGLLVCHSIVTGFGGSIAVVDRPGKGATFRVVLPLADGDVAAPPAPASPIRLPRGARILVVDDEASIGSALARVLTPHEVTFVQSGRAALDLCTERAFDCILCDVMMPDLGGPDIHETLRKDGRGLEQTMIFMTGGAFAPREMDFLAQVPNHCIDKPFDLRALEEALVAVLARGHAA